MRPQTKQCGFLRNAHIHTGKDISTGKKHRCGNLIGKSTKGTSVLCRVADKRKPLPEIS